MKVIISEIPDEGLELELTEKISSDESIKIVAPVKASLKIDKKGSEVIITGRAKGTVELQCSRCLKAFDMDIDSAINVVYHPASEINKEEHYELKGDELDTGFYKNDTLDTEDLLKEQLVLNIPMKPLCSNDCKGLCPKCGANLNITQCNCLTSEVDSRLAVLKQLLNKKEVN
ncbi:hypothetical protein A45J_2173 [hot springs metagenome]|uniref:DUF177 domain-containing protein n=1 Tax=hot springs metagenome TaxID=433727 RepID=A0A5J4L582_9ZZZZ